MTQPTDKTKMIPLAQTGQTSVQRYGDDRQIQMEIKALKIGLPNMANASDAAVTALLIAAKQSGLNPYRGEIYYTDKGVTVAAKIRVADAITAASRRGDSLAINFYPFTPADPLWEEMREPDLTPSDTAFLCEIISSRARQEWYKDRIAFIDEQKALGYDRKEIEPKLKERFPHPPVYRAVGIVKGAESFGEAGKKFVAFTRSDRAKKRALTKCLNANGLAAPDQRSYGDVLRADDPDEGGYQVERIVDAAQVQAAIDPEFAAAVEGEMVEPVKHTDRLSRNNGTAGDEVMGQAPKPKPAQPEAPKPAQPPAPGVDDLAAATAEWKQAAKEATECGIKLNGNQAKKDDTAQMLRTKTANLVRLINEYYDARNEASEIQAEADASAND